MNVASILILLFVVVSIFGGPADNGRKSVKKARGQQSSAPVVAKTEKQNTSDTLSVVTVRNTTTTANYDLTRQIVYAGEDDYQIISSYIIGYYPNVPLSEAERIAQSLVTYGMQYKIDPKLITALIARESSFRRTAVSSSNAKGLGQIKELNYPALCITDPFDIEQNVKGCTQYFCEMLDKWKGNSRQVHLALASYKEGYGAITSSGGSWKKSTELYIKDILSIYSFLKTRE